MYPMPKVGAHEKEIDPKIWHYIVLQGYNYDKAETAVTPLTLTHRFSSITVHQFLLGLEPEYSVLDPLKQRS